MSFNAAIKKAILTLSRDTTLVYVKEVGTPVMWSPSSSRRLCDIWSLGIRQGLGFGWLWPARDLTHFCFVCHTCFGRFLLDRICLWAVFRYFDLTLLITRSLFLKACDAYRLKAGYWSILFVSAHSASSVELPFWCPSGVDNLIVRQRTRRMFPMWSIWALADRLVRSHIRLPSVLLLHSFCGQWSLWIRPAVFLWHHTSPRDYLLSHWQSIYPRDHLLVLFHILWCLRGCQCVLYATASPEWSTTLFFTVAFVSRYLLSPFFGSSMNVAPQSLSYCFNVIYVRLRFRWVIFSIRWSCSSRPRKLGSLYHKYFKIGVIRANHCEMSIIESLCRFCIQIIHLLLGLWIP